jgi:hypothetical protein
VLELQQRQQFVEEAARLYPGQRGTSRCGKRLHLTRLPVQAEQQPACAGGARSAQRKAVAAVAAVAGQLGVAAFASTALIRPWAPVTTVAAISDQRGLPAGTAVAGVYAAQPADAACSAVAGQEAGVAAGATITGEFAGAADPAGPAVPTEDAATAAGPAVTALGAGQ